jgi:hypothetical protein
LTSILKLMTINLMRTTLTLDDDLLEGVRQYAESQSISMSRAASEILRRGLHSPVPTRMVNGIRVFAPRTKGRPITLELIRELEAQDDLDRFRRALR